MSRNPSKLFSDFKLYSYCWSSASWRVRIALNLKKIPYEYSAVDLAPVGIAAFLT
jgi:glutathione S-transferase